MFQAAPDRFENASHIAAFAGAWQQPQREKLMANRSRLRGSVTINEASSAVKTMGGAGEVDVSVGIPHLASQVFRGGDHFSTGHRGIHEAL